MDDARLFDRIVTGCCLLYAVVWLVMGFRNAPLLLEAITEPPPVGVKYIPAAFGGFFLLAAAPAMRGQDNAFRAMFACGIGALISPGLWAAAHGEGTVDDALLWLAIPIAIAFWVLIGNRGSDSEKKREAVPRLRPPALAHIEDRVLAERMNSEDGGEQGRDVKGKPPDWLKHG
jgi:hypothetical protein